MTTLEEKKAQRWRYLKALYEATNGRASPYAEASEADVALASGLSGDDLDAVIEYLINEGLAEHTVMGPVIGITHFGVKEYERAMAHPEQPTHYFPPIISIGNLTNSQIQIGSHGSSQVQHITQGLDGAALTSLLAEIRSADLPHATRAQLDGILTVLEQQKKPDPSMVKALLTSAKAVVDGVGAVQLVAKIGGFLAGIPGV